MARDYSSMDDHEHERKFYDSLEKEKQSTGPNHKDKKYINEELYKKAIEAVESRKFEKCPSGDAHFKDWARRFTVETNPTNGEKILKSNPEKLQEKRRKQEENRKKRDREKKEEDETSGSDTRRRRPIRKLPVLKYEDYFREITRCHGEVGHNMENTWKMVDERWYFVTKKTVQLFCEACSDCRTAPKQSKRRHSSSSIPPDAKRPRSWTHSSSQSPASSTHSSLSDISPSSESAPSSQNIPSNLGQIADSLGSSAVCPTSSGFQSIAQNQNLPSDLEHLDMSDILSMGGGDENVFQSSSVVSHQPAPYELRNIPDVHGIQSQVCQIEVSRSPSQGVMPTEGGHLGNYSQPTTCQPQVTRVPLTRPHSGSYGNQTCEFGNYGNEILGIGDRSASRLHLDFCHTPNTSTATGIVSTVSTLSSTSPATSTLAQNCPTDVAQSTLEQISDFFSSNQHISYLADIAEPPFFHQHVTIPLQDQHQPSLHSQQVSRQDAVGNSPPRSSDIQQFPVSQPNVTMATMMRGPPDHIPTRQTESQMLSGTEHNLGADDSDIMQYDNLQQLSTRPVVPARTQTYAEVPQTSNLSASISLKNFKNSEAKKSICKSPLGQSFEISTGCNFQYQFPSQVAEERFSPSDIDLQSSRSAVNTAQYAAVCTITGLDIQAIQGTDSFACAGNIDDILNVNTGLQSSQHAQRSSSESSESLQWTG